MVPKHRLNSCGTLVYLLHSMWDFPGPGIEPVSPASAGRFFITEPPGMPTIKFLSVYISYHFTLKICLN